MSPDAGLWTLCETRRRVLQGAVVSDGNRMWRGAHTQQTLASVIRTACQRHLEPHALLVDLLCAQTPIVAPSLQPPAQ